MLDDFSKMGFTILEDVLSRLVCTALGECALGSVLCTQECGVHSRVWLHSRVWYTLACSALGSVLCT